MAAMVPYSTLLTYSTCSVSPSGLTILLLFLTSASLTSADSDLPKFFRVALKEKGLPEYQDEDERFHALNVSKYHFPKKTPARLREYAPKKWWSRYRDYKTRPATGPGFIMKVPSRPIAVFMCWEPPKTKKNNVCDVAILHWCPPKNDGHTPILHYEVSMDEGQTWIKVNGGAESREYRVQGNGAGDVVSFRIRAVNRIGPGEAEKTTCQNAPLSSRLMAKLFPKKQQQPVKKDSIPECKAAEVMA
mmetsp:Transcript_20294/g.46107  ORF Transcript_20294/g.46107 Transcript_20294/m.46107 type:complete len:246 (+) Transcript_20294:247-984(+)